MRKDPFEPISTLDFLGRLVKQFFAVWIIVLIPVFGSIMMIVYQNLPIVGAVAGYGALVTLIAFIRTKSNKIEVQPDLSIKTVRTNPVHPELLKYTLIINAIFAVEALFLWLAIP